MKYYLLNGKFCENRPKGEKFTKALKAHHEYWADFARQGMVLLAGPKVAGSGLLIIKCEDESEANKLCNEDPFVVAGVQTFEIDEFKFFNGHPCVHEWFDKQ